jgi:transposase
MRSICGSLDVILPIHLALTPGEAHDNRLCSALLSALLPQTMLLADRGYDADWIREFARQKGVWSNIPPKRNRKDPIHFSPYLYRARNLVERFFNKIKQCRRVATRYDKLAVNYLAFVKLASIRILLRAHESTPWPKGFLEWWARSLLSGALRATRWLCRLRLAFARAPDAVHCAA